MNEYRIFDPKTGKRFTERDFFGKSVNLEDFVVELYSGTDDVQMQRLYENDIVDTTWFVEGELQNVRGVIKKLVDEERFVIQSSYGLIPLHPTERLYVLTLVSTMFPFVESVIKEQSKLKSIVYGIRYIGTAYDNPDNIQSIFDRKE